jgi:phosphate transport system substrate-binding protein
MLNLRKAAALLLAVIFILGTLSACSNRSEDNNNTDTNKNENTSGGTGANENLSGTITMAGSTSMEKLANVASEAFMEKYPKVVVSAEFIGSSAGVEAVLAGTVNIGNASRNLKDTEKSSGAVENVVAIDGIAVIIDKNNTTTNLSKDQLIQIYTGQVNNWSQVGGINQPIVVVGREAGSGTRGAFEELLGIEDQCKYSNEINSTGGVMAKVTSTPGAIGYVSLDIVDDTVVAANVDDVEPTEENIKAGTYLLSRPFVMATKGELSAQSKEVQAFFDYLKSDEGKELINSIGLITVD